MAIPRRRAEEAAAELARVYSVAKSNAALLKANEDLGQFAYAASHDLQEPLRMMTTYAQLLARRYKDLTDEVAGGFIVPGIPKPGGQYAASAPTIKVVFPTFTV